MRFGLPGVTAKTAMSLDGRVALRSGMSRWITSEAARADVQRLRAQSSAILTGIGTVLADDPLLTVRDPVLAGAGAAPLRVVLDTRLRMPPSARMLREAGSTLVLCGETGPERRVALAEAGARVIEVPVCGGRPDLTQVLRTLAGLEVNEVLVEAGPVLTGTMLAAGLVDELVAYVAPRLLGGDAMPMVELGGYSRLEDALHLEITDVRAIGSDWRITARPVSGGSRPDPIFTARCSRPDVHRQMFTGIIEAVGRIAAVTDMAPGLRVSIDPGPLDLGDVRLGDSIAVQGVCLTVVELTGDGFAVDVSEETLRCTTLGECGAGVRVNLEKALCPGGRLGGHFVTGHVDGIGTVAAAQWRPRCRHAGGGTRNAGALSRPQGLRVRGWDEPHREPHRGPGIRGPPDPAHAVRDHRRQLQGRDAGQYRGRSPGPLCRIAAIGVRRSSVRSKQTQPNNNSLPSVVAAYNRAEYLDERRRMCKGGAITSIG